MRIQTKESVDSFSVSYSFIQTESYGHPQLQIPTSRGYQLEAWALPRTPIRNGRYVCSKYPQYNGSKNYESKGLFWCSLIHLGVYNMEFSGKSISSVGSRAYYRYSQVCVSIQFTVESGVTQCWNVEDVRTHDNVIHVSTITLQP